MQEVKVGPFKVDVNLQGITLSRENGSVKFSPSDGNNAVEIVMVALGLETMKILPERISNSPMQVRFTPERIAYLLNKNESGEVAFKFDEGDDLIEAIKAGVDKTRDQNTLGRGSKKSFSSAHPPDPIIHGR